MLIFNMIWRVDAKISCRIYSRCFIQIIYLQTGIICEHHFTGQVADRSCFNDCIFFKCFSVLDDLYILKLFVFQRRKCDVFIAKYLTNLFHLAFISCCYDNFSICIHLSISLQRLYNAITDSLCDRILPAFFYDRF